MNFDEAYDRCLIAHAYNWIENYRSIGHIEYLEFHAGPVLARAIEYYGISKVILDFIEKTSAER
jgi:hypothetical protein